MPSAVHNIVVELLEAHPDALSYLLALNGTPPSGPLIPTNDTRTSTLTLETRVDRAFVVGSPEEPQSFLFAEVQLDPDDDKRFAWPLYVELARSRHRCEGGLVVLTFSERVRRWIERVILPATGEHGSSRQMLPTVIAVDAIALPLLFRPEMPHLVPLAVAAHVGAPDVTVVAEAAVDWTIEHVEGRLAAEQVDAILCLVDRALRGHLERRVMEHRGYRSELFQGIFEKGAAEGRAEGRAAGTAEARAKDILVVLAARQIPVSDTLRERILRCTDLASLELWLRRAAIARTAAAVVRPTSGSRPRAKPAPQTETKRVARRRAPRA